MADSDGRRRRQVGKALKSSGSEETRPALAWRNATVDEIVEHFKNR